MAEPKPHADVEAPSVTGARPVAEEPAAPAHPTGVTTTDPERDLEARSAAAHVLAALRAAKSAGRSPGRIERDLRGARLIDQDLSGLDLSGFDLSGADLSRCDLTGARLVGTRLREAVLFGARIERAQFLKADLRGADLGESRGERAGFGSADLSDAKLFNADLSAATFTRATLRRVDARAANFARARLREADLGGADLSRATLRAADLEHAAVQDARFVEADLRQSRPRGISGYDSANWIGADILDVDFCGAYLLRRTIMDQNYLHEFRKHSRVNSIIYWVWWVTSDCGRSFLRWGLWTLCLAALFAGLYRTVAVDYGEHATWLSSFYYSVVTLTTLGYGDVTPASTAAQVLAMVEVVLGYVMLGGLLSIFANKMARRAE